METNQKLGFFKKIKIAIFNLEKYGQLITENLDKSIKYMAILILICSICFSILDTINVVKMTNKCMDFITNQMPDFELKDGEIKFESQVYGYDEEFDIKIESKEKYNLKDSEIKEDEKAIILLKDKLVFNAYGTYSEYTYNFIKQSLDIEEINKQEIINIYNELGGKTGVAVTMFITLIITIFIANAYEIILYCLIVAIFGYLTAQISKIKIKFSTSVTLAIYSLTLPVILNLIYIIQYNFTGFEVPYFDILYLGIAYIYIIAAILIIKTDLIKQVIELQKVQQEQKKILEESEKREEENKQPDDEKKEKPKDDTKKDTNQDENSFPEKEPDGSEI